MKCDTPMTFEEAKAMLGIVDSKPIKMTNEEYLRSLNTEQLAEWLRGVYWHCHEIDCKHCNYPWRCMEKGDIVEWLKQPHTPTRSRN